MYQDIRAPGCSRFGMTDSFVPFQPNVNADGTTPNPLAGRDDAIFDGATDPDPGGLPLGTLEHLELSSFFNAPGAPFDVTVHLRSGKGTLAAGNVALRVPAGLDVDAATKPVGPVGAAPRRRSRSRSRPPPAPPSTPTTGSPRSTRPAR